jgi:hypothetical protein
VAALVAVASALAPLLAAPPPPLEDVRLSAGEHAPRSSKAEQVAMLARSRESKLRGRFIGRG